MPGPDRPDELTALALAAGRGDRAAMERFVRSSQAEVWRVCRHLGGREVADDLTQETYARVWRALPTFRGDSSARTWLLSIARRVCADDVRKQARRRRLHDRVERQRSTEVVADPSTSSDVHALIADLPDDQHTAFVLTQLLGLSYEEAAAVADCAVGTIRSRVARAREALVEQYGGRAAGEAF